MWSSIIRERDRGEISSMLAMEWKMERASVTQSRCLHASTTSCHRMGIRKSNDNNTFCVIDCCNEYQIFKQWIWLNHHYYIRTKSFSKTLNSTTTQHHVSSQQTVEPLYDMVLIRWMYLSAMSPVGLQIGTPHSSPFLCTCFVGKSRENMYRGMARNAAFLFAILPVQCKYGVERGEGTPFVFFDFFPLSRLDAVVDCVCLMLINPEETL